MIIKAPHAAVSRCVIDDSQYLVPAKAIHFMIDMLGIAVPLVCPADAKTVSFVRIRGEEN
jgi:hypothetical protein